MRVRHLRCFLRRVAGGSRLVTGDVAAALLVVDNPRASWHWCCAGAARTGGLVCGEGYFGHALVRGRFVRVPMCCHCAGQNAYQPGKLRRNHTKHSRQNAYPKHNQGIPRHLELVVGPGALRHASVLLWACESEGAEEGDEEGSSCAAAEHDRDSCNSWAAVFFVQGQRWGNSL